MLDVAKAKPSSNLQKMVVWSVPAVGRRHGDCGDRASPLEGPRSMQLLTVAVISLIEVDGNPDRIDNAVPSL